MEESRSKRKGLISSPGPDSISPWNHVVIPYFESTSSGTESKSGMGTWLGSFCKDCSMDLESENFCPVCLKTFSHFNKSSSKPLSTCFQCSRLFHTSCGSGSGSGSGGSHSKSDVCPLCDPSSLSKLIQNSQFPQSVKVVLWKGKKVLATHPHSH